MTDTNANNNETNLESTLTADEIKLAIKRYAKMKGGLTQDIVKNNWLQRSKAIASFVAYKTRKINSSE